MTNETCSVCGAEFPRFAYCMPCDTRTKAFDAAMDDDDAFKALHPDDKTYVVLSMRIRARGHTGNAVPGLQKEIAACAKASGRWARY